MRLLIISSLLILIFTNKLVSRQSPYDFKKGMFGVTNPTTQFNPGTKEFGDALGSLKNGNADPYAAIDLLQFYQYFNVSNSGGKIFYKNFLKQADSVGIKILISAQFNWADYDTNGVTDGIISSNDSLRYAENIQWIVSNTTVNAIGGWYIADEPEVTSINPSELEKLYKIIKDEVPSNVNNEVYVTQAADFETNAFIPPGNRDYGKYIDTWDNLIIGWYGYSANIERSNIDIPTNYWFKVANLGDGPEGTIRGWNYIQQKLKSDIGFPNNLPPNKKVYALLVLGEEIPENTIGGRDYYTFQSDFVATHGITHAAINKVYNMGFDGMFFYDYLTSDPSDPNEFREDAAYHWIENERYAEAIETEIHDQDWLVTSLSNSSFSQNRTYLSIRGSSNVNTAPGPCQGVVGQCPAAGYNEEHSTVIKNLASGDLWGEETSDFTYIINSNDNRKSIADGDDELVYTTSSENFWVSEEDHTNSLFGNTLNSNQLASYGEKITAMTTGDFDGDGDYEVVTAVSDSYRTWIYISNDANDFKQKTIYYKVYPASESIITALAAGDFEGLGRDQLITATWNQDASDMYIYLSDIAIGESPIASSNAITSNTSAITYVNAFATGDFDGDFRDELATAFRTVSGNYSQLTISKPKTGGGTGNPGHGSNMVWYSPVSYETVTALAAGDFKNERKDYLITALWNSSTDISNIYQSRPYFDSSGYGKGNPTHTSNPETSHIYKNGTYWHVTAMTAGSFRESLPSGASKVATRNITETKENLPDKLYLAQNYPNPFNPTTRITYQVPEQSLVSLEVYNMLAQKVATLVNQDQAPGEYTVNFNGQNLSSGVYLYILKSGNTQIQKKMLLIK